MDDAITNPFWGLGTGSTFNAQTRKFTTPTVLMPGITQVTAQESKTIRLSGNSDYVYTDSMNQGSTAVSGSYGLGPIGQISAAATAYVGNTHSESEKSLAITLNCVLAAGIEYVDFDNLTPEDFVSGLKVNVKNDVIRVLEKFAAAAEEHDGKTGETAAMDTWAEAVRAFNRRHGTGVVVATLWGGWVAANLIFKSKVKSSKWVYGGSAEFSYQGTGGSLSVSATYGGSQNTLDEGARADVSVAVNGKCVSDLADRWATELKAQALKGLDSIGSTPVSPQLNTGVATPRAPDFSKPKTEEGLTAKIDKIKDIKGLEVFAQAAAYDNYKAQEIKDGREPDSLAKFLADAASKNVLDPRLAQAAGNGPPTNGGGGQGGGGKLLSTQPRMPQSSVSAAKDDGPPKPAAPNLADYEPLGVWIAPWSSLFPWLVCGQSNEVPANSPALDIIELRRMQQDFLTLSKLYSRFARNTNEDFYVYPMTARRGSGGRTTFEDIANEFASGVSKISRYIASLSKEDGNPRQEIADRKNELHDDARVIYDTWVSFGFLRTAELGLAITMHSDHFGLSPPSTIVDFNDRWPRPKSAGVSKPGQGGSYAVFADAIKGWPLIYRDDSGNGRVVCYVEAPYLGDCGILAREDGNPYVRVWHGIAEEYPATDETRADRPMPATKRPIYFTKPPAGDGAGQNHLFGRFNGNGRDSDWSSVIGLWPIPFEAADGIPWKGLSMAADDRALTEQVREVAKALSKTTKCSFDDIKWQQRSLEDGYNLQDIKPSYVGLIKEPTFA